jgi:4'-phosphopantetheinyl transferase
MTRLPDEGWRPLPPQFFLADEAVHVIRATLDRDDAEVGRFKGLLSPDEQARANRFHFDRDRRRFIVGRGILRSLLGQYLQRDPALIQFDYGAHGKPRLGQAMAAPDVRFNLAHSQALALIAFSRGRELGVDIEAVRPISDADRVAERYFSPNERQRFRDLPQAQKLEAFYSCWTRKEAFIKAIGDGLSYPLDQFDVSLVPGEDARLLAISGDEREAGLWSLRDLRPGPDFIAALAIRDHGWSMSCWHWPD